MSFMQLDYGQYLLSSPVNYALRNPAACLSNASNDLQSEALGDIKLPDSATQTRFYLNSACVGFDLRKISLQWQTASYYLC